MKLKDHRKIILHPALFSSWENFWWSSLLFQGTSITLAKGLWFYSQRQRRLIWMPRPSSSGNFKGIFIKEIPRSLILGEKWEKISDGSLKNKGLAFNSELFYYCISWESNCQQQWLSLMEAKWGFWVNYPVFSLTINYIILCNYFLPFLILLLSTQNTKQEISLFWTPSSLN